MSDSQHHLTVPKLNKGDTIYITAPAKAIEAERVEYAKHFLEQNGFKVLISKHCIGRNNYFSGTDDQRASDFQEGLDNPEVKAILCARGGYGSVRILDRIQWASQLRNPKYIIGFSDITIFHHRMQRYGIPSIHGTMPLNFEENSKVALSTLLDAIEGKPYSIDWSPTSHNKYGSATGQLVGGNLSVFYGLLGTDDQIDYTDTILFFEDLSEPLYAIDRMLSALDKAGVFDKIKGLVLGGMTDLKDSDPGFGIPLEEIILEKFTYRNIPVAFDCPAGHINDNRALVFGELVTLTVNEATSSLNFKRG